MADRLDCGIGIVAHDISDGLNTMLLVTRGALPQEKDFTFLFADAAAPILGGLIVLTSALSAAGLGCVFGANISEFFLVHGNGRSFARSAPPLSYVCGYDCYAGRHSLYLRSDDTRGFTLSKSQKTSSFRIARYPRSRFPVDLTASFLS